MKVSKTFDHLFKGKCQTLEVHATLTDGEVTVNNIYALESNYTYNDNVRAEDIPHAMIELTQVFHDYFPEVIEKLEDMDWSDAEEMEPAEQPSLLPMFGAIVNPHNSAA